MLGFSGLAAAALALASCSSPTREHRAPPTTPAPHVVSEAPVAPAAKPAPAPTAPRNARIEMTFVGDMMFGGYFKDHYKPYRSEHHDPLAEVAPLLVSDLPVGNLETTIARALPNNGDHHDGSGDFRFVTLASRVAPLKNRLAAVTLANNHMFDNDVAGLADTTQILGELGVGFVGASHDKPPQFRTDTVVVGGWRVGFVAASTRLNRRPKPGDPLLPFTLPETLRGEVVPVIEAARRDHDLVIAVVHWGNEYEDVPMPWQVETAHAFVDAGAHVVIGHHPHVLQGIERYRDSLIAYSLGNFVFPNAKRHAVAGVLRLGFARGACFDRIAFHPIVQRPLPLIHPAPANATERALIARHLFDLSAAMSTKWEIEGERYAIAPTCPTSSSASPAASSR
jgi:poly-gamma-glutamate synthesis protein (capsule biosynthesis protein)